MCRHAIHAAAHRSCSTWNVTREKDVADMSCRHPGMNYWTYRLALIQSTGTMAWKGDSTDQSEKYWHFYDFRRSPQSSVKLIGQCMDRDADAPRATNTPCRVLTDRWWWANKFALGRSQNKVHPDINWKLKLTLLCASIAMTRIAKTMHKLHIGGLPLNRFNHAECVCLVGDEALDVPKCISHCLSNTCLLHELFASGLLFIDLQ